MFVGIVASGSYVWGQVNGKIDTLEEKEKDTGEQVKILQSDLNKQAVTIGQIQITTKNIEKQQEAQQRLLERIAEQLARPNN